MTGESLSELPDVTVVIPAYNLATYLADAVDSVLQQSYRGRLAIVILDDGSSDNTLAVAQSLAARDPRVEVHTQTNQGRARTRNHLIDLAKTELIAWLDADDLASPYWIEQQVDYLQSHLDCVAVSGQGNSMTASGRAIGPMDHPLDGDEIDRRHISGEANAFFQSCVTVRKSAVIRAGRYDPQYPCAEDYSLWLRLAEIGRLANLPAIHLYYRVHSTSANWTVNVDQRRQGQSIMNEARLRRGLPPLAVTAHEIPPAKKDDWNRRLYWINIALRSGNPRSALEMLRVALPKHPCSLLLWLAAMMSIGDTILFAGNRTASFSAGSPPRIGTLPRISCYRFCRGANRIRRRLFSKAASTP